MTIREITELAGNHPVGFAVALAVTPVLCALLGLIHGRGRGALSPWKYFYAVIIYLTCIPGILSVVLTAYTLFFTRENLLDVNLIIYFFPIISMAITLVIIARRVSFDDVPGFDRLSGLMVIIAVTFVLALGIQKTRVWIFFGGSFLALIVLLVALFLLLKWGAYLLFSRKRRS